MLDVEASNTQKYVDGGAHCISPNVGRVGGVVVRGVAAVDRTKLGTHVVTYDCCYRSVCALQAKRIVRVVDTSCPYCHIIPGPSTVEAHFKYHDPGAVCTDGRDGACLLTKQADVATATGCVMTVTSDITTEHVGTYRVTYRARDALGNWNDGNCLGSAHYVRVMTVVDTLKPVIALRMAGTLVSVGGAGGVGVNGEDNPAVRVQALGESAEHGDLTPLGVELSSQMADLVPAGAEASSRLMSLVKGAGAGTGGLPLLGVAAAAIGGAALLVASARWQRRRRRFDVLV